MRKLLFVVLLLPLLAHSQIYKWTDENGVVHFSSDPGRNSESAEQIEVGPTNSGTLINERQKKMTTVLESDREMQEAFRQIRKGSTRGSSESGSCKLYRVWLEDEKSELESLRRRGYTIDEEQYQKRQVEEAQRRVKAFC